jgi:hypothetical protein
MTIGTQAYLQGYTHEKTAAQKQEGVMRDYIRGSYDPAKQEGVMRDYIPKYMTDSYNGDPDPAKLYAKKEVMQDYSPERIAMMRDYIPKYMTDSYNGDPDPAKLYAKKEVMQDYSPERIAMMRDYIPKYMTDSYNGDPDPAQGKAMQGYSPERIAMMRDYIPGSYNGDPDPAQGKAMQGYSPDSYTREPAVRGRGQREQDNAFSVVQGHIPRPAAGRADISAAIRNKLDEIIKRTEHRPYWSPARPGERYSMIRRGSASIPPHDVLTER